MMRLILGLTLLLCIVGCPMSQQPPRDSVVSVAITGDVGVEFAGEYEWSDGKTDPLSGVVRDKGNGSVGPRTFHNGIPDDHHITSLTIRSLSETGKLGVTIKRIKSNRETVVFEGQASGEGAKIVYSVP